VCVGMYRDWSFCVVHVRYEGFEAMGDVPFVRGVGQGDNWWAVKFERREEVSSVFDFSKVGRRITDGLPVIMFLCLS
jgi:hypothetical protein